jgi:hypothetical protein
VSPKCTPRWPRSRRTRRWGRSAGSRPAYQQNLLSALAERGVRLVAISPQAPDGSLSMQEKHDLASTVLTDPGNGIAHTQGI